VRHGTRAAGGQIACLDGQAALSRLVHVTVAFLTWSDRRRLRQRRLGLHDRLLRDVGSDWLTAPREVNRVFWRV